MLIPTRSAAMLAGVLLFGSVAATGSAAAGRAPAAAGTAPRLSVAATTTTTTGSVLETGQFYEETDLPNTDFGWRFTGQGDGLTTTRAAVFDVYAAQACNGGSPIDMIGIMRRDGVGPWGGHVLSVRFYSIGADGMYHPVRDLTGAALLACIQSVNPDVPDGTLYTITTPRVEQDGPAGVGAADGSFDLVSHSNNFGYLVAQYLPGHGWQPAASIGGIGFEPTVLRLPSGVLRIFGVSQSRRALYTGDVTPDRRFLGWHSWGGVATSLTAAPVLMPDGSTAAYVYGSDGTVHQAIWWANGRWRGWFSLGRPSQFLPGKSVAAASTGAGRATVAAADIYGIVYTRYYVPGHGWSPWPTFGKAQWLYARGLTAVSPSSRVFDLYWMSDYDDSTLNRLYGNRVTDGRWAPRVYEGVKAAYVFASFRAGRTDLWADVLGVGMSQRTFVNGQWGSWHKLPYGN